jgi:hypothetical protein
MQVEESKRIHLFCRCPFSRAEKWDAVEGVLTSHGKTNRMLSYVHAMIRSLILICACSTLVVTPRAEIAEFEDLCRGVEFVGKTSARLRAPFNPHGIV